MKKNPLTLSALVAQHAGGDAGSAPAILYQDSRISYAELDRLGRIVAHSFEALGVRRGDRVAVWLPNVPAWQICLLACARLGATVVAINTRFRSSELAQILGKAEARLMVLWPHFRGIDFISILEECDKSALSGIRTYVCYAEDAAATPERIHGMPAYSWLEVTAKPESNQDLATPDSGCVVFCTSGTTGSSKLALHTQRSVCQHAHDTARAFGFDAPGSTIYVLQPMCGTSGFGMAPAAWAAGRPQSFAPIFDEAETAQLIQRHQVTHMHASHDMLRRMFAAVDDNRLFESLRLVNCGTAAPQMVGPAEQRGIRVVGIYGSSEMQARYSKQDERLPAQERAVGGGMPISPDAAVRVRCVNSGQLLPPNEAGELELKGPSQFTHYLNDAEISRRAITGDGYYRSGDLGHMLPDGRIVFLSRLGDAMRLSGFLVSPAQIEQVIVEHPSILACHVVGTETPAGLRPVAFVQMRPGHAFDEQALTAYCRQRMAPYKTPAAFFALDAFPVTEGPNQTKVQKAKLREMAGTLLAGRKLR